MLAVGLVLPPQSSPEPEEQAEVEFDKYSQNVFFFLISLQQLVWRIKCKCIKHIGEISTIFCSCGRETLTKDECRSAMDHYAHSLGHCCYGRKPARDHEIKDLTSRTALRVRILRLVLASHTYCPVQLNLVCYPDYSDVQSIN